MQQRLKMTTMVRSTRVTDPVTLPCDGLMIRKLTPDDVELFGKLIFEVFKDSVHRHTWKTRYDAMKEARSVFASERIYFDASFIAVDGAMPISLSVMSRESHGPFLNYIGTITQYRRCGLAGELVRRSLKAMYSKGFIDVYLSVADLNKNAVSRYRSLGFEPFEFKKSK